MEGALRGVSLLVSATVGGVGISVQLWKSVLLFASFSLGWVLFFRCFSFESETFRRRIMYVYNAAMDLADAFWGFIYWLFFSFLRRFSFRSGAKEIKRKVCENRTTRTRSSLADADRFRNFIFSLWPSWTSNRKRSVEVLMRKEKMGGGPTNNATMVVVVPWNSLWTINWNAKSFLCLLFAKMFCKKMCSTFLHVFHFLDAFLVAFL